MVWWIPHRRYQNPHEKVLNPNHGVLSLDSDWTDMLSDIVHNYGIDPSVLGVNVLVRKREESVVWKI
jgi:hypothetical protein